MNPSWNEKLPEEVLHERMLRGRKVLADMQQVLTLTYGRKTVSEISRHLNCSRRKVIWMQRVLQQRSARGLADGQTLSSRDGHDVLEEHCVEEG